MSLMYRLMYRVGFTDWELASASTDTGGEISGPLLGVPRTWYRLVHR